MHVKTRSSASSSGFFPSEQSILGFPTDFPSSVELIATSGEHLVPSGNVQRSMISRSKKRLEKMLGFLRSSNGYLVIIFNNA